MNTRDSEVQGGGGGELRTRSVRKTLELCVTSASLALAYNEKSPLLGRNNEEDTGQMEKQKGYHDRIIEVQWFLEHRLNSVPGRRTNARVFFFLSFSKPVSILH